MGHRPAPARRSVGRSDDERQAFAPLHRTRGSHNRQAAFAPAPPDVPARFASAQWLPGCQFLRRGNAVNLHVEGTVQAETQMKLRAGGSDGKYRAYTAFTVAK